jgi:hypothetical protein
MESEQNSSQLETVDMLNAVPGFGDDCAPVNLPYSGVETVERSERRNELGRHWHGRELQATALGTQYRLLRCMGASGAQRPQLGLNLRTERSADHATAEF